MDSIDLPGVGVAELEVGTGSLITPALDAPVAGHPVRFLVDCFEKEQAPAIAACIRNFCAWENECAWEPEHGLQIVLRDGLEVTRISPYDGHATHRSAWGASYEIPDGAMYWSPS